MPKFRDLAGLKFGRLTALSRAPNAGKKTMWSCLCDCGTKAVVQSFKLISGHTQSCGCIQREVLIARNWKGGVSESRSLRSWHAMLDRCYNKEHKNYPHYGGRGIEVCERWRTSFQHFLADMGERPPGRYSIDRIDNEGNYEPGNCRWATQSEQLANQRRSCRIEFQERILCIAEWARVVGISKWTITSRLRAGWPIDVALTKSPQRRKEQRTE